MKVFRLSAIILLVINGIGAVAGGIALIGDPSGRVLGWTTAMLEHSPFEDYLLPGIILFVFNGLLSMAVAFLTLKKRKYYSSYIILQGAVLCGWIIIQIMLIRDYHPLHLAFLAIGLLLIACGYILSAITPLSFAKSGLLLIVPCNKCRR